MTTRHAQAKASKKKSFRKASISKATNGGAAVEKGRSFEDQVADLYRLLGARVTQNIEIHQKKVDILATFRIPGSSREHTVIVECKDEQRSVAANQRIMAFKGLLDVARKDGIADSAEIVTRVPWSDQAKGFAKTSGVELFTYTEKISQLIDLTPYMKGLVNKFDKRDPARPTEPPLGSYYVDLSAQKTVRDDARLLSGLSLPNAANLLNRISPDYFAGKDLSDTTLTKANFWKADLRGTNLKNARLSGAILVDARFFRSDIVFSKIDKTRVFLHVLKIRKYSFDSFFNSMFDKLEDERELEIWRSSFNDDLAWQIDIKVKDIKDLEFVRAKLSAELSTKVSIYFDEFEELERAQDKVRPRTIRKPSRLKKKKR